MTNSDNGNRPRTAAHQPGDRVRVRHNPARDRSYSVEQNRARAALGGQIGSIRERAAPGAYRVAPPGSTERGAWFEADELEPPLPPIGSRVRVKAGLHEGRVLEVKQHRRGEILAEQGPRMGWYDPSEVEPWGGAEIENAPAAPLDVLDAAVQQALAQARREVLLARGEAEEALQAADRWRAEYQLTQRELGAARLALQEVRQEAAKARGETGALAVRLGAAEAERDALRGACEAVVGPAVGVSAQALATAVKDALAVQLAAVMRTADHRCADARRIAALEARVARLETMGTGMGTEATARAREPKQGRSE